MPAALDSDDVVHDVGDGVVDGAVRDCLARTASRAPLLKRVFGMVRAGHSREAAGRTRRSRLTSLTSRGCRKIECRNLDVGDGEH